MKNSFLYLLISFLLFLVYIFHNVSILKDLYLDFGDSALICLKVKFAKEFAEYLGPYSRLGFFHPGPIIFYYYAILEKIFFWFNHFEFKSYSAIYGIFQFFFNYILILASFFLFPKEIHFKIRLFGILIFLFLYENLNNNSISNLFSIWGPFIIIIPFWILILSTALLLYKRYFFLIPLIFPLSAVIISNHLSAFFYIGIFNAIIFIYMFLTEKNKKKFFIWLFIGIILFLIIFLPTIIEFVKNFPNDNISKIIEISKKTNSLRKGKEVFIYFFELISIFIIGKPEFVVGILVFLIVYGYNLYKIKKTKSKYNKILFYISSIQTIIVIIYIFKIPFDLLYYLSWFYVSIFTIFMHLTLIFLFEKNLESKLSNVVLIILIILNFINYYNKKNFESFDFKEEQEILNNIYKNFIFSKNKVYKINWGFQDENHSNWVLASGIIFYLTNNNVQTCVEENWIFMFDKFFSCKNYLDKEIFTLKIIKLKENYPNPLFTSFEKEKKEELIYKNFKIVLLKN